MTHRNKGTWLLTALCAFALLPFRARALSTGDLLTPVGRAVAIELETEGVIVAGLAQVETEEGQRSPAGEAGLQPGDVSEIVHVDSNYYIIAVLEKDADYVNTLAAAEADKKLDQLLDETLELLEVQETFAFKNYNIEAK